MVSKVISVNPEDDFLNLIEDKVEKDIINILNQFDVKFKSNNFCIYCIHLPSDCEMVLKLSIDKISINDMPPWIKNE